MGLLSKSVAVLDGIAIKSVQGVLDVIAVKIYMSYIGQYHCQNWNKV